MVNGRSAVKLLLRRRATWTFELCCLESPINKWWSLRIRNRRVRGELSSKIEKGHPSKTIASVAGVVGEGGGGRGRREKNLAHFSRLPRSASPSPITPATQATKTRDVFQRGEIGMCLSLFSKFPRWGSRDFFPKALPIRQEHGLPVDATFWSPVDKWFSWIQLKLTCQAGNYLSPTSSNFQILSSHFQELYLLSYVIYKWFFSF